MQRTSLCRCLGSCRRLGRFVMRMDGGRTAAGVGDVSISICLPPRHRAASFGARTRRRRASEAKVHGRTPAEGGRRERAWRQRPLRRAPQKRCGPKENGRAQHASLFQLQPPAAGCKHAVKDELQPLPRTALLRLRLFWGTACAKRLTSSGCSRPSSISGRSGSAAARARRHRGVAFDRCVHASRPLAAAARTAAALAADAAAQPPQLPSIQRLADIIGPHACRRMQRGWRSRSPAPPRQGRGRHAQPTATQEKGT